MKRRPGPEADGTVLRRRAAARLRARKQRLKSESDATRLRYELEVHQVELETQNEELRRVKEELETALERYTELYDLAPVGYCVLDQQGVIQRANLTASQLLGVERLRLTHRALGLLVAEGDRPVVRDFLQRVFASQTKIACEVALLPPPGRPTLSVQIEGTRSPNGGECHAVILDITERQQVEASLRQSEQILAEAENAGKVGGWQFDPATGKQTWTAETYRIHEVEPTYEPTVEKGVNFYTPETRPIIARAVQRAVEHGEPFDVELEIVTAKGNRRNVHAIGRADPQHRRVHGFFQDITQHKKAEEALRQSELFTKTVLNSLTAHIAVLDGQGVIIAVNEPWRRFAQENGGADASAYVGSNYLTVCEDSLRRGPDQSAEAALAGLRAVMSGQREQFHLEYPCHSSSERRWFTLCATRFPGAGMDRVVVAHDHITERKRTEEELARSRAALRALTARLEEMREQERQHLAREIHGTFGHALTAWKFDLVWLSRRLAEAGLDGRTAIRLKLATMSRRAEEEMESVRRIAGELRPALLDTIGLAPAIEWLARDFQARTHIRCRAERLSPPPALSATHATKLFRILQELLNNVVRQAQARAVDIRLTSGTDWVELRVRDNGRGISQRAATNPTSLGLLGIRERAAALGGEFEIRGSSRHGTTATVRLPLAEKPQPE